VTAGGLAGRAAGPEEGRPRREGLMDPAPQVARHSAPEAPATSRGSWPGGDLALLDVLGVVLVVRSTMSGAISLTK
jgi:hypothetical protein